jgi:hypothetical protein
VSGGASARLLRAELTVFVAPHAAVMDAAKVMRLLLDHPEASNMSQLKSRFLDITKRIVTFPCGEHASAGDRTMHTDVNLCCIPTTSGTGAEVTPFAVVSDEGVKYPLCSYAMTPQMGACVCACVRVCACVCVCVREERRLTSCSGHRPDVCDAHAKVSGRSAGL